ncbi:plasmid maintenance system killer protein [Bacillus sp. BGMRC0062]|nr:plasmid maintenance system killer protein [Bacillus sp. BGMRC0062]
MKLEFEDEDLENLAYVPGYRTRRWPSEVSEGYQRRIQDLQAATSEQDLRARKALHLEKLKGKQWPGCHSIRINIKYRLIVRFIAEDDERVTVVIDGLDYH